MNDSSFFFIVFSVFLFISYHNDGIFLRFNFNVPQKIIIYPIQLGIRKNDNHADAIR